MAADPAARELIRARRAHARARLEHERSGEAVMAALVRLTAAAEAWAARNETALAEAEAAEDHASEGPSAAGGADA